MLQELLGIFFPKLCFGCNRSLLKNEQFICASCIYHLPVSNYHLQKSNALEKTFWGRVNIEQAFAFLFFKKGNITQHLLHELKYKGNKELGVFIGSLYGQVLKKSGVGFDAVTAIPLHASKLQKRGYNQSDFFALGLASHLQIENLSPLIVRTKATETQTKKSRFERWENVASIFELQDASRFENKHILIVDDVITTGSTIEACAQAIGTAKNCRISVGGIAVATQ